MQFLRILIIYLTISAGGLFYFLLGGESDLLLIVFFSFNALVLSYFLYKLYYIQNHDLESFKDFEVAVMSSARVSMIMTDPSGLITHFSRGAQELLGYSPEELIGHATPAIIHDNAEIEKRCEELNQIYDEDAKPGFATFVRRVYELDKDENEWTYIKKDGTRFPVILSVTAIKNYKKEIVGFMGVATDLTSLKQKEEYSPLISKLMPALGEIIEMSGRLEKSGLGGEQLNWLQFIKESAEQARKTVKDFKSNWH